MVRVKQRRTFGQRRQRILVPSGQGIPYPLIHYHITKTLVFKYIENFTTKNLKFSDKNSDIFHISAHEAVLTSTHNLFFLAEIRKNNVYPCHYENTPIQIYRKFHLQKLKIFR